MKTRPTDHIDAADIWRDHLVIWKDTSTWYDRLTRWLGPRFASKAIAALQNMGEQDICDDDFAWREDILGPHLVEGLDLVRDDLADDLRNATLRVYHGCRIDDAGVYHRQGLVRNDPTVMEAMARRIVAEEDSLGYMRDDIERCLAEFDHRDRDTGKLYVSVDDRELLDSCGHYALYGAEWLQALFSFAGFEVLRRRGVPTILEIDLPLPGVSDHYRKPLADELLNEWTRVTVNRPGWTPSIDFTIALEHDLPSDSIVNHYHPEVLKSPYYQMQSFRTPVTTCPSCTKYSSD